MNAATKIIPKGIINAIKMKIFFPLIPLKDLSKSTTPFFVEYIPEITNADINAIIIIQNMLWGLNSKVVLNVNGSIYTDAISAIKRPKIKVIKKKIHRLNLGTWEGMVSPLKAINIADKEGPNERCETH